MQSASAKFGRHKYAEVYTYLRVLMQQQRLGPGDALPTEHELCEKFACSRPTVRRAIEILANQGAVGARQGSGTFILSTERMGYYQLGSRRPLIAVIIPNTLNVEITRFVHTLGWTLIQRNGDCFQAVTNDEEALERDLVEYIAHHGVEGVIKFPTQLDTQERTLERLAFYGIPSVVVNDFWSAGGTSPHVSYDERAAVRLVVNHLVKLGHRSLAFVESDGWPRLNAVNAFLEALRTHGLPHERDRVFLTTWFPMHLDRIFGPRRINPTAFVTTFSIMAWALIRNLAARGLRVPQDVSVANISGGVLADVEVPDMTCALPPDRLIAEKAVDILVMDKGKPAEREHLFTPTFHAGATCAAPSPHLPFIVPPPARSPAPREEALAVAGSAERRSP